MSESTEFIVPEFWIYVMPILVMVFMATLVLMLHSFIEAFKNWAAQDTLFNQEMSGQMKGKSR